MSAPLDLDRIAGHRVAVIGDIMLDCYISGEVERLSPEAPVPVMRVRDEHSVPGGAANVAANLASLGVVVELVGMVGSDPTAAEIEKAINAHGAVACTRIVVPERPTTRKIRVIGARQQIVRIDHEDASPFSPNIEAELIAAAEAAVDRAELVVLSDYGKGVCCESVLRAVLDHARARGKTVIVDPKKRDFGIYRGATILTPNRRELTDATQLPCQTDEEALAAAHAAQGASEAAILLTRSEKGMSFYPVDGVPIHMATVAQDVFDVSGAGDTVVAALAAALVAHMSLADAMRIANHAAGIVVSKLGTAVVTRDELEASMLMNQLHHGHDDLGLQALPALVAQRRAWAQEKLTVGFTNGCFDLLHPGHISLLRQAAESCDRLIVGINADASVRRLKGATRPVQDEAARATVLSAIRGVSGVLIFAEDTPRQVIEALQPDVLVKGADYTIDRVVGADIVQARGGRVILASLAEGHSTSRLVAVARDGDKVLTAALPLHSGA
ncbi:D-glycero-beta-D-manno-heptose-7-phosphate kinase [Sphingomonas nostoxanthinifaciens]|uniref:D-glycero-beta-D-manno-heptose-7-phosphate kinase n=1 Tax=Sphingomonas nostoxanthinifaciens TaxID=2872652 RepID=UPI001CC218A9|nr:D-glycero-beta-D-manno-heptose-7-phosphate kinase [Sphingomonas nostoxanthinifaciens]UAK25002.1 D-glycero-beta-D-manno-heptose-7-phosphate kinase [Sphingomonas nostoxanthinifaciens]